MPLQFRSDMPLRKDGIVYYSNGLCSIPDSATAKNLIPVLENAGIRLFTKGGRIVARIYKR